MAESPSEPTKSPPPGKPLDLGTVDHYVDMLENARGDEAKTLKYLREFFKTIGPSIDDERGQLASQGSNMDLRRIASSVASKHLAQTRHQADGSEMMHPLEDKFGNFEEGPSYREIGSPPYKNSYRAEVEWRDNPTDSWSTFEGLYKARDEETVENTLRQEFAESDKEVGEISVVSDRIASSVAAAFVASQQDPDGNSEIMHPSEDDFGNTQQGPNMRFEPIGLPPFKNKYRVEVEHREEGSTAQNWQVFEGFFQARDEEMLEETLRNQYMADGEELGTVAIFPI